MAGGVIPRRTDGIDGFKPLLADIHELPAETALDAEMAASDGVVERRSNADDFSFLSVNRESAADAAVGADGVRASLS